MSLIPYGKNKNVFPSFLIFFKNVRYYYNLHNKLQLLLLLIYIGLERQALQSTLISS